MKTFLLERLAALRSTRNAHVLRVHSAFCVLCALQTISRTKVFNQEQMFIKLVIPTGAF